MVFTVKLSSRNTNKTCKFTFQADDEVNPDQFIKRGSFRSDYDFRMYDNRKTFLRDLFKLAIEQGSPIEYVIVDGIRKWERTSVWDRGRFVETEDLNKHILDGRLLVKELVQANY